MLRSHPATVPTPTCRTGSARSPSVSWRCSSLVADGRSNKWIAEHLSLSALTVKSHLSRISRKLGTGDRSHQVAVAIRAGMLR